MMQNGFRRIALAQGLLPARLAMREVPANAEPAAAARPEVTEEAGTPTGGLDGDPEMRGASAG